MPRLSWLCCGCCITRVVCQDCRNKIEEEFQGQQAKLHEAVEEALRSALQVSFEPCMRVNSKELKMERHVCTDTEETVQDCFASPSSSITLHGSQQVVEGGAAFDESTQLVRDRSVSHGPSIERLAHLLPNRPCILTG